MGFYTTIPPLDTDGTLGANSDLKVPSQKAAKTYVDSTISSPIKSGGIGYRTKGLEDWFSKFQASSSVSPVDVVMITDSIWDIGAVTTDPSPVSLLARQLNALKGMPGADAGGGLSSLPEIVHAQPFSGPSATSSQGTVNSNSTAMQGSTLTNGQVLTHVATCTSFTIVYQTNPSYGTLTVRDGAGGAVLGTINCSGTAKSGNMWTSSALSDGAHTLHVTSSGTTCPELIAPNRGQSVRVWPCGLAGALSDQFSSNSTRVLDFIDTLNTAGTLGLVIVATGVNDADYSTSVPALISAVQGHTSANIALWLSYINNAFPVSEYGPARTAAYATNLPVIDGTVVEDQATTVDNTHPDSAGRQLMAAHTASVIGGDPIGSALRFAGNTYIGSGTSNLRLIPSGLIINNDTALIRSAVAGTLAVGTPLSILFGTADGVIASGLQRTTNPQTGLGYSVVLADKSKFITRNNASNSTQTWPKDSTAAFVTGAIIETANTGIGAVVHSAEAGATITGNLVQPANTTSKAIKTAANTWFISTSGIESDTDATLAANSDSKLATQKAVKTYADNVLARPPATYGIGYRPRNLSAWYSAFEAATTASPIDVVVLGDSIASLSSPEYGSWPDHLGLLLNRQAGMYNASTLARQPAMYKGVNLTHNGTTAATGFGRTAISLATGQTALYSGTIDLTRVAIVYSTSTLAGNLVIRETDGSGSILQTINCSGATSSGNIWEGAVSASKKSIHITATGGTAILEAVYPLVNNPVRVWNASLSGAASLDYVNQADRALNFIDNLNTAGTLKLVIIATSTNDSTSNPVETTNEINQLITLVKGHTSATVAQVIQSQNAALTAAEITSLRLNAETLDIPTIDFARSLSDLTATGFDGVHPIPGASEQSMGFMAGVILGGDPYGTIIRELLRINPVVTANTTALLGASGPAFSLSGSMLMNESEPGNLQLSAVFSPASGVIHAGRRQNINSQTGTSYTTNTADKAKIITRTNSSASTHTWPQDSDQSIGIGTIIEVINSGTGAITHSAGTGATLSSGSSTLQSPKTKITGIKTAANTWFISNSSLSADTDGTLSANSDAFVPSQKAVKTYVDTTTPLPDIPTGTKLRNSKIPDAWFNSLRATSGLRYVVVIADSFGVSYSTAFPWQLEQNLISLTNTKSTIYPVGWRFASGGSPTPIWTTMGGTPTTATTGGYGGTLTAGQKGTIKAVCDGVTVFYRTSPGAGSLIVRDGVGGTTLATISTNAATGISSWTSGALTAAERTIEFEASGGTVVVDGSYQTYGNRTDGIRVIPASRSGDTSKGMAENPTRALDLITYLESIDQLALVITATGTNDSSIVGWQGQLIDAVETAVPGIPVVSWIPPINQNNPPTEHEAMKAEVLTKDVELIDGSMLGRIDGDDGVHPTTLGHSQIAAQIANVISGDPLNGANMAKNRFVSLYANSTINGSLSIRDAVTATSVAADSVTATGTVTAANGLFSMAPLFGYPYFNIKEPADAIGQITMYGKVLGGGLGRPAGAALSLSDGTTAADAANLYYGGAKTYKTNSDLHFDTNAKGVILIDRTDAKKYRLYVDGGVLGIEEVV